MKNISALLILVAGIIGMLLTIPQAQAVPAFARQMGVSCDICHFQHFPLLNGFGRAFKSNGFTMTSTPLIESENISMPENLNAAIFTNIRFQKSTGSKDPAAHTSNNGEWIIPGETSLFIGGRVSIIAGSTTFTSYCTQAWGVDGQILGSILHDTPLSIYFSYGQAPGSTPGSAQKYVQLLFPRLKILSPSPRSREPSPMDGAHAIASGREQRGAARGTRCGVIVD